MLSYGKYPRSCTGSDAVAGNSNTCAQDSQSGGDIIGRDMASLQLLMQVCQLVCGISACISLPRSHIQDTPHLRNYPGLPKYTDCSVDI